MTNQAKPSNGSRLSGQQAAPGLSAVPCTGDEDLALAAQNGSSEAFEELIFRYKPLALSQAARFYLVGGDRDDLIQEGMIGLFKAVRSFDPKKGPFGSLAKQAVRNQILDCLRRDSAAKQKVLNESSSLSAPPSEGSGEPTAGPDLDVEDTAGRDPLSGIQHEEALGQLRAFIDASLSERERNVLLLYIDGKTDAQAASELSLNLQQVKSALARARYKIRHRMFSE